MDSLENKKQLMFLSGEDFYFFAYNILIALDVLGCKGEKSFKDHRKLAFLIYLISDDAVINILERHVERSVKNKTDIQILFNAYVNGLLKKGEISKLLFSLEARGFIVLEPSTSKQYMDVKLVNKKIPSGYLQNDIFQHDRENCIFLSKLIKRLSVLKLETMLQRVFDTRGIKRWDI